jgi:hypothetical protein
MIITRSISRTSSYIELAAVAQLAIEYQQIGSYILYELQFVPKTFNTQRGWIYPPVSITATIPEMQAAKIYLLHLRGGTTRLNRKVHC